MQKLRSQKSLFEKDDQFEKWLNQKMLNQKISHKGERVQSPTYQVPVVIHVIHNGEAVNIGTNISDAQIISQIKVLNNDFKRLNADAANTPAEFNTVAGSMDIEFVMAKRNPEGLATNGIMRVLGTKTSWTINDNYQLKALSYWPAEDYLNIWVCNITDYLGYTQFPVSDLPGLENSSNNRLTDGLVIWYKSFGSIDDGAFDLDPNYNKGRTATHEIGHFFGLRHIWGDDDGACGGNSDYVNDTPDQSNSSTGCPTHPRTTCSVHSMFQNYLDYSDDDCMNIFTQGQVNRMISVIENSPRRVSLLTSPALLDPAPVANDLGIKQIISPSESECTNTIIPSIELRNYGSNFITAAQIELKINNVVVETINPPINIAQDESVIVNFSSSLLGAGTSNLHFQILSTNSVTDGNPDNNIQNIAVLIPDIIVAPFTENFTTLPSNWQIKNLDQVLTWQLASAPDDNPSNIACYMNFYDYEDHVGELDILTTPVFDLSSSPAAVLIFDVAYARFQSAADGLKVIVLTDCNPDINQGTIAYNKSGLTLATTSSTSVAFVPTSSSQWRREIVDLGSFLGQSHVQLAFVGANDWGNNLYLDNIAVLTDLEEDLAIKQIISPSPVTCELNPSPSLVVQNLSTVTITNFKIEYIINAGATLTTAITGITLQPGNELQISIPTISLQEGSNTISINLTEPNGSIDNNNSNSNIEIRVVANTSEDIIPLRENFNEPFEDRWTMVNPTDGMPWQTGNTFYNTSVYFNAFNNLLAGDEAWLVSPVLDFSKTLKASVFFDLSYAYDDLKGERLRILGSTDCGNSYTETLYDYLGQNIMDNSSSQAWTAENETDWARKFINLSSLAGEKNVRLAFVVTNGNGNNLYLDNLEFYTDDDATPLEIEKLFTIYNAQPEESGDFKITFDLPERQNVGYDVIDTMGRLLVNDQVPDVLNQTFLVDMGESASGIYIVRLKIGSQYYATKIFVSQ